MLATIYHNIYIFIIVSVEFLLEYMQKLKDSGAANPTPEEQWNMNPLHTDYNNFMRQSIQSSQGLIDLVAGNNN